MAGEKTPAERDLTDLVAGLSPDLFRLAFRLAGSRQDAEDLVQEAFLRALPRLEAAAAANTARPYLRRILVRAAIDRSRRKRATPFTWEVADPRPGPEEQLVTAERARRLREALAGLSDHERTLLVLLHAEGWSVQEVASALSVPQSIVKNRAFRARERLRRLLGPDETREEQIGDDD